MPKPIFVRKNNVKMKTNKYSKNLRIWMDTLKLPYYSSGSVRIANHPLEKILEEETLLHEHNSSANTINKNESPILTNNHAFVGQDSEVEKGNSSQMNGCLNFDNADSVEHPLLQRIEPAMTAVEEDIPSHLLNTCKYVNNLTTTTNLTSTTNTTETLPNDKPNVAVGPIYKKKHLKRAFDKPGEDKVILSIGEKLNSFPFHILKAKVFHAIILLINCFATN